MSIYAKFWPKIKTFVRNQNFNFGQKSKFLAKNLIFLSQYENFRYKSKFSPKNQNYGQKIFFSAEGTICIKLSLRKCRTNLKKFLFCDSGLALDVKFLA